jgi:hypothetical protein
MAMPIAQHLGFDITDVGPGRFEISQPFRRELSFREGTFQAGPIWHDSRHGGGMRRRDDVAGGLGSLYGRDYTVTQSAKSWSRGAAS